MKRLRDVAVRMRPPATNAEPEAESGDPVSGEAPLTGRTPFMPSSRDLARGPSAEMPAGSAETAGARPPSKPRRHIWDLEEDDSAPAPEAEAVPPSAPSSAPAREPEPEPEPGPDPDPQTASDAGPAPDDDDLASRARRALAAVERQEAERKLARPSSGDDADGGRTRVLGFRAPELETDPISAVAHRPAPEIRYPAGWLVVVEGPGRGAFFAVTTSVSSIGRGADQSISLNFGDASISRQNHAAIAYDAEQNRFFLGHGSKSNIVRRNGQPVLATEEMFDGDAIRIGKTTLRFVALCGEDFTWGEIGEEDGTAHE